VDLHKELDIISEFRKITRVRTCGKSARIKCLRISQKEKKTVESREKDERC
jgi:hypothetical protein